MCFAGQDPGAPAPRPTLFPGFFAAGFECTVFRRKSGEVLDVLEATGHLRLARQDYGRLQRQGIQVAREGIRWHLVEPRPGRFDFSSVVPIIAAARESRVRVIWDLCHFSWPVHVDLLGRDFPERLAAYALAFARWLRKETGAPGFFVPVNEISFLSWAAGEEGSMYPFLTGRGWEVKVQLVRAALRVMDEIWADLPDTEFLHVDPLIHVVAHPAHPEERPLAEAYRLSQFQAFDMLSGRLLPELGGSPRHLPWMGLNYYPHNQWFYGLRPGKPPRKYRPISRLNPRYKPLRELLEEAFDRYRRPIFIAETGAENRPRAAWFNYVAGEVLAALEAGVPIHGICLYPILNHPGWVDDRHCHNGLWDYPDETGKREIHAPLARALRRWRGKFQHFVFGEEPARPPAALSPEPVEHE